MTTPTPDVLDTAEAPEGTVWEDVLAKAKELRRDLAARDAELAEMRDEREGNTRQFRRLQDRLAQAEVDEKFWKEVSAEQRAELLKIAENPYEGNESALDYSCTHWKQQAFTMAAGQCIVTNGGLMADDHGHQYCDMERQRDEWKRKAEEAARVRSALEGLLAHCDDNPEGETDFERAVIAARAAIAAKGEA